MNSRALLIAIFVAATFIILPSGISQEQSQYKAYGGDNKTILLNWAYQPLGQVLASAIPPEIEKRVKELQRLGLVGEQCGDLMEAGRPPFVGPMFNAESCAECKRKCQCVGEGDPAQCDTNTDNGNTAYIWDSQTGLCGCGRPEQNQEVAYPQGTQCRDTNGDNKPDECGGIFYYTICSDTNLDGIPETCAVEECPDKTDPNSCPKNECTSNAQCREIAPQPPGPITCESDADCDDSNACTNDKCIQDWFWVTTVNSTIPVTSGWAQVACAPVNAAKLAIAIWSAPEEQTAIGDQGNYTVTFADDNDTCIRSNAPWTSPEGDCTVVITLAGDFSRSVNGCDIRYTALSSAIETRDTNPSQDCGFAIFAQKTTGICENKADPSKQYLACNRDTKICELRQATASVCTDQGDCVGKVEGDACTPAKDCPFDVGEAAKDNYYISCDVGCYPGHTGVDIASLLGWLPQFGDPLYAVADGTISYRGGDCGTGYNLRPSADPNAEYIYCHLLDRKGADGEDIADGAIVRAGDLIGHINATGNIDPPGDAGTHLHFAEYHFDESPFYRSAATSSFACIRDLAAGEVILASRLAGRTTADKNLTTPYPDDASERSFGGNFRPVDILASDDLSEPLPGCLSDCPGTCPLGEGLCSIDFLMDTFGHSSCEGSAASQICQRESGGNPFALNNNCLTDTTLDYSVGLFQINLLAHANIDHDGDGLRPFIYPVDLNGDGIRNGCIVTDQDDADYWTFFYQDVTNNIAKAHQLYGDDEDWCPTWGAACACGIP